MIKSVVDMAALDCAIQPTFHSSYNTRGEQLNKKLIQKLLEYMKDG